MHGFSYLVRVFVRLGWNNLPVTHTLAYYWKLVNYGQNKFYNIGPWSQCNSTSLSVIYVFS
jgi:hypothetical protein